MFSKIYLLLTLRHYATEGSSEASLRKQGIAPGQIVASPGQSFARHWLVFGSSLVLLNASPLQAKEHVWQDWGKEFHGVGSLLGLAAVRSRHGPAHTASRPDQGFVLGHDCGHF